MGRVGVVDFEHDFHFGFGFGLGVGVERAALHFVNSVLYLVRAVLSNGNLVSLTK